MITIQEAVSLGCNYGVNSCPVWMSNYLVNSTSYGGTHDGVEQQYWTMSAVSSDSTHAMCIFFTGGILDNSTTSSSHGARAVVVINK